MHTPSTTVHNLESATKIQGTTVLTTLLTISTQLMFPWQQTPHHNSQKNRLCKIFTIAKAALACHTHAINR